MAACLIFLISAVAFIFLSYNYGDLMESAQAHITKLKHISTTSKKWIVVTSNNHPTEDIKRLAEIPDWQLVVVAVSETPKSWAMDGVHFLSLEEQELLGYNVLAILPNNSYTRKNIGYLYAIQHGAEWIYDTDDDNKPYAKTLFSVWDLISSTIPNKSVDYDMDAVQVEVLGSRLFNPYQFFGSSHMWPRGFPLDRVQNHTNGHDRLCLCHKMRPAAIQQGLVHKDSDVDAIFGLLHANNQTGLDENFNKIAPPVVLESDIWRSYLAQKLLHLVGETIAFYPVNTEKVRNVRDYTIDFEDERDLYLKTGTMVDFLNEWECEHEEIADCALSLAAAFSERHFWKSADARATREWINDLRKIGYQFPVRANGSDYLISHNEKERGQNCREADLEFETSGNDMVAKNSVKKVEAFGTLADWCAAAGYIDFLYKLPSPSQLARLHDNNETLRNLKESVLTITSNYPWNYTIGLIQRIYEPYFGFTIFCGSWLPQKYVESEGLFPERTRPFNYINMSAEDMHLGHYAYYCSAKAKDLRLGNVKGYFFMADDTTFNFWNAANPEIVMHPSGDNYFNERGWWLEPSGKAAAIKARVLFEEKYIHDQSIQATWQQFKDGLKEKNKTASASETLTTVDGWSVSDLYYIPATGLDYHAKLMEVFFEAELFHEIAIEKYLHSVPFVSFDNSRYNYLYGPHGRETWHENYNESLIMMHPIKPSFLGDLTQRKLFCDSVLMAFYRNLMTGESRIPDKT